METKTVKKKIYEESLTHSTIGSNHWYHTLLFQIDEIGWYMENNRLTDKLRISYGEHLQRITKHMANSYCEIPTENKE